MKEHLFRIFSLSYILIDTMLKKGTFKLKKGKCLVTLNK